MAHPSRRTPSSNPSHYYAVPQSPQNHPYGQHRQPSRSNRVPAPNDRQPVAPMPPRNDLAQGVATGAIGAGYGPYSVRLFFALSIILPLIVRLTAVCYQASPFCGYRKSRVYRLTVQRPPIRTLFHDGRKAHASGNGQHLYCSCL